MSDTYTQLLVQLVFAVKGRENLVVEKYREQIEKYITGIISNRGSKLLAIYCNPDHIHILIGLNPDGSISDLVRDIKSKSTKWINENKWFNSAFKWQQGFGAFSYSKSHLNNVVKYILNQPEHHKKKKFKEEYIEFLEKFEVDFNETYLFEWLD